MTRQIRSLVERFAHANGVGRAPRTALRALARPGAISLLLTLSAWHTLGAQSLDDHNPPAVSVGPNGIVRQTTTLVSASIADDQTLDVGSFVVTQDGVDRTADFAFAWGSSCGTPACGTLSGNVAVPATGTTTITITACDMTSNCSTASTQLSYLAPTSVSVTPYANGTNVTAYTANTFTLQAQRTTAGSGTYSFALVCSSAITSCSPDVSSATLAQGVAKTVTLQFNVSRSSTAQRIWLRATNTADAADKDSAYVDVFISGVMPLSVSTAMTNYDDRQVERCAVDCFTASRVQSTVPYFSGGQARSVALVYNGDNLAVRPFVYADVSISAGATRIPTILTLRARVNGVDRQFLNGAAPTYTNETVLTFTGGSALTAGRQYRLGGQFSASDLPTGTYPMDIIVSAQYTDTTLTYTTSTRLAVVNDAAGTIARGWRIAGWSRVYPDTAGVLLVDGGSAAYFKRDGVDRNYYAPPTGEYSYIRYDATAAQFVRQEDDSTRSYYGSAGFLDSVTFINGRVQRFAHDASGRLTFIEDPVLRYWVTGGQTTTLAGGLGTRLTYSANGLLTSIAEPGTSPDMVGRTTQIVIDSATRTLRQVIDPDTGTTRFTYDTKFRLDTVVDRKGGKWRYVYDDRSWKVTSLVYPAVNAVTAGGGTALSSPIMTLTPWQTRGVPTVTTGSAGAAPIPTDSAYATVHGIKGGTTRFTVDRWGQPLRTVGPLGQVTSISRTGPQPVVIVDERGQADTLEWERGRLKRQRLYKQSLLEITYGKFAEPEVVYENGLILRQYGYGSHGELLTEKYAGQYLTTHAPDAWGRDTLVTDPKGHQTRTSYDPLTGNVERATTPSTRSSFAYDAHGRETSSTIAGIGSVITRYDSVNRVVKRFSPGVDSATTYTYDRLDLLSVTDAQGRSYARKRNALGWPTLEYDPLYPGDSVHARRITYGTDGLARTITNRRGQTINVSYDSVGRIRSRSATIGGVQSPDSQTFTYAPDGRWYVARNSTAVDSVVYGLDGSDTVITRLAGGVFTRVHSPHAGPTAEGGRWIDSTTYTIGSGGVVTSGVQFRTRRIFLSRQSWLPDSVYFGDAAARIYYDTELSPNSLSFGTTSGSTSWLTYAYNNDHRLSSVDYTASGTAMAAAFNRGYAYDSVGRDTMETFTDDSLPARRKFAYDAAGHLASTRVDLQKTNQGTPYWMRSAERGMTRTTVQDNVANLRREIDSVSTQLDTAVLSGVNQLASWGGNSYTYDADGNRIQKSRSGSVNVLYTWNAYGQLTTVAAAADTSRYAYDALGQLARIEKRRSGTLLSVHILLWDLGNVVAELDSTGSGLRKVNEYIYGGADAPIAVATPQTSGPELVQFFARDNHGTIAGLFGSTGVVKQKYDGWGTPLSTPAGVRQGWKGMFYEGDSTQLYYARNRWYDASARRFVSEDPASVAGGMNLYAFGGGDPINQSDPSGLGPCVGGADAVAVEIYFDDRTHEWEVKITCPGGISMLAPVVTTAPPPLFAPNNVGDPVVLGMGTPLKGPPNTIDQFGRNFRLFGEGGGAEGDLDFHYPHGDESTPHWHWYKDGVRQGPQNEVPPEMEEKFRGWYLKQLLDDLIELMRNTEFSIPIIVVPGPCGDLSNFPVNGSCPNVS